MPSLALSFILREECGLKVVRRTLGPKGRKRREIGEICVEEQLYNLYFSHNI
jgi:hypothetical protein